MKVCVLQPDYSTASSDHAMDYQYYDPPRDLSSLLPGDQVDHVALNKLRTYAQLKELGKGGYDIFVNLCEGYLEWEVPSIDVIQTLELLNLPFTGPSARLYDPPKELMKYVAYTEGVKSPEYILIRSLSELDSLNLPFPLFVKPAKAGDSLGIDHRSLVHSFEALSALVTELLAVYDELLVETYITGREFTVLVAANPGGVGCRTFKPVEYIFPQGFAYKTYSLKTSELHPEANIPCSDPLLEARLRSAASRIFQAFSGVGYARLDFRVDASGNPYFLEINFTCSVFYKDGYEGSADFVLKHDGIGQSGFLQWIIEEGIRRHALKQRAYEVKGSPISGYGIYASRALEKGACIFQGEGRAQRIITRSYVERNWSSEQQELFTHYAYPLSREVFILWDRDPSRWAPQNHSCSPNTEYHGLNVYASRAIDKGEELTLDYATMMDGHLQPFECHCGSPNCRGMITGIPGNTVTVRAPGRNPSRPAVPDGAPASPSTPTGRPGPSKPQKKR